MLFLQSILFVSLSHMFMEGWLPGAND